MLTSRPRRALLPLALLLASHALLQSQNGVGVIVDRDRASPARAPFVHVLDPDTMQITGSVALPLPGFDRRAGTAFGVEQTAVDPCSRRRFVSGLANGEVRVFDSVSGTQLTTITHPDLLWGLGISMRR